MTTPTQPICAWPGRCCCRPTYLSSVNGLEGELIIAGFPVQEIASQATFEEVAYLLWNDALPTAIELDEFRQALAAQRASYRMPQ